MQALSGMIGRKASRRWLFKSAVKSRGSTTRDEAVETARLEYGCNFASHEAGIASNRRSAHTAVNRSRALYTPPVTLWELAMPEVVTLTARGMPKAGLVTG
ncbi:hypothetical protein OIU77_001174, partial [Salix suchowensis]